MTRRYPARLYVVQRKLSPHAKGDTVHLFSYPEPPEDTEHGELIGVYELQDVVRQVIERKLIPAKNGSNRD